MARSDASPRGVGPHVASARLGVLHRAFLKSPRASACAAARPNSAPAAPNAPPRLEVMIGEHRRVRARRARSSHSPASQMAERAIGVGQRGVRGLADEDVVTESRTPSLRRSAGPRGSRR